MVKIAHVLKDGRKEHRNNVYLLPGDLWNLVKSYQLNWLKKWRRDMKPVLLNINFTIQCLKTGKYGNFIDNEDKIVFNIAPYEFSCSWNSKLLPRNNVRIWHYWRDEEKDWKKYPFIWLNEQEGEYFTCHCCILQEELERWEERQNIQNQRADV